jgi:ribose transport system substrate-binding protein
MSAFIERITGSQVGGATERSIRLSLSIIRLGPAIILLLLVLAMTLVSPVFLTGANISNVVVQTSVLAVLAIGQLFVILLDTDIPKWKPKDSYVGTDNFAAGLEAGRYLKGQMNGEGSIGLITGIPGSVPGDQREAGMRKAIENTNIKVVGEVAADFDRLKAVGAMEDLLQTHPELDAVFATNDQMALGAIEALQTYQSDAILVGVDGAVEATQAIIGGDMDATVAQNPYAMGKVGVQQATKAANGKSIDPRINTGLTLVTKKNAPGYLKIREEQLGSLLGVEE